MQPTLNAIVFFMTKEDYDIADVFGGSPAVKQNNQTAMFYFKKAADKAIIFHMRQS